MDIIFRREADVQLDNALINEQIDALVLRRFSGWTESFYKEKAEELTDVSANEIERAVQMAVTNALCRLSDACTTTVCAIEQVRLKQTEHFIVDVKVLVDGLPGDSHRECELEVHKYPTNKES